MKKLFVLLLVMTIIDTISYAQKIDIADRSNVWHMLTAEQPPKGTLRYGTEFYYCRDTTVIIKNGKAYTGFSLCVNNFGLYCSDTVILRSDTASKKVYYYRVYDSSEHVFFDYNLQPGDSFILEGMNLGAPDTTHFTISNIDSIYINGIPHKRFWFACPVGFKCASFAEGIGYLDWNPFYILDPIKYRFFNLYTDFSALICFKNNGTYPNIFPPIRTGIINTNDTLFITSCNDTILTVNNTVLNKTRVIIYPQPAMTSTIIKLPQTIHEGSIAITNTLGQIVLQNQFKEKQELEIHNQGWSGIYFYRITDENENMSYSGKIIFQ
jgi:hypothetical protein